MTTYFNDLFAGSGIITGHAPDLSMGSEVWASSGAREIDLVSGYAVGITAGYGNASIGAGGATSYGIPGDVQITFTLTPISALPTSSNYFFLNANVDDAPDPRTITWKHNGTNYVFELSDGSTVSTVVGGFSLGTEYTGVLTIVGETTTFTMNGFTVSNDRALGYDNSLGLKRFSLRLPTGWKLNSLTATDVVTAAHGDIALTLPMPILISTGTGRTTADVSLVCPMPQLSATAHQTLGENAIALVMPTPTLQMFGGASVELTMPKPVLSASATVRGWAQIELTCPMPTLSATGKVADKADIALTMPKPTLSIFGGASVALVLPMPTMESVGAIGAVGQIELVMPRPRLAVTATAQNHGSIVLVMPMPVPVASARVVLVLSGFTLNATATAVIAATYEAYAINLKPSGESPVNEVTRYTNFPFTQVIRYKNSYYGVAADGLYLLEGTTDYASPAPTPIRFNWKTAQTDFKIALEKTVVSAYFGGVMGPNDTVTLYAGNKEMNAYKYTTPRGNDIQNHRQKFGRGIKARYFAVGVSGSGPLELDGAEFNLNTLTRRI